MTYHQDMSWYSILIYPRGRPHCTSSRQLITIYHYIVMIEHHDIPWRCTIVMYHRDISWGYVLPCYCDDKSFVEKHAEIQSWNIMMMCHCDISFCHTMMLYHGHIPWSHTDRVIIMTHPRDLASWYIVVIFAGSCLCRQLLRDFTNSGLTVCSWLQHQSH